MEANIVRSDASLDKAVPEIHRKAEESARKLEQSLGLLRIK